MKIKRFLRRNIFNILLASTLIIVFGSLSTLELESERQEGQVHLNEPIQTVYAMEAEKCNVEYIPSVQELIINTCKDYGVDSDLAIAIARLETGNWSSDAFAQNNVGGLKEEIAGEWVSMSFNTLENGVGAFVRTLKNIGTDNMERLAEIYCPHNPNDWMVSVNELLKEK